MTEQVAVARPWWRTRAFDDRLLRVVPFAALVAAIVWFGETRAADRKWIDVGTEALYLAAVALGVNILVGYTGLLSLGHAGFFVAGGYMGAVWIPDWGLSPWWGLPAAFAFGAVLGAVLALMCCHLRGFYLTVVTLAFGLLLPSLVSVLRSGLGGPAGRTVDRPIDVARLPLAGGPFDGLYYLAAILLLVTLIVSWNLVRTRWGRAYMAIRESEVAAQASGISTYWVKVSSFALSAGIVAAAGVLGAQRFLLVSPGSGSQDQSFRYVIMVVLGGMGTLVGPILGAAGITFGFALEWVQDTFRNSMGLLFGGMGLLGVALAPTGAVGSARSLARRAERWREDRGRPPRTPRAPPVVAVDLTAGRDGDSDDRALLVVEAVTRRFGGVVAVDNVDLVVARGTIHGIIGPNGSGKSTLINLISGFTAVSAGAIRFAGRDVTHAPPHRRSAAGMARTFQNLQVWRRMSVLQNVLVGLHRRGRVGLARALAGSLGARHEEDRLQRQAWGLLHFAGLADRAAVPVGSLTFGDQRRVEIARALAAGPELVLLDEPAAGLRASEVHRLAELISTIRDAGITVLVVEHHMDLVMNLCDQVTVLDQGSKICEGTPDEVRSDPRVVEAYLGAAGDAA